VWWAKHGPSLGAYPHHAMMPSGFVPKIPGIPMPKLPEPGEWETTPRRKSGRVVKHECKCGMRWSTSVAQAGLVKRCPSCGVER
jgi:hypothetical protein